MNRVRIRVFPECNYLAVQTPELETFRFRIVDDEPISWLAYPEVVDVSLGTLCDGGCRYCYVSATRRGVNYERVAEKLEGWLVSMSPNQRPFQVAFGGGGEPTMHPEFIAALEVCYRYGVVPNYTTNGLHLSENILAATARLCGGVAVTAHEHLPWRAAARSLSEAGVRLNVHVIVGAPGSAERARRIRDELDYVENVVILPLVSQGFARREVPIETEIMRAARLAQEEPGYAIGAMYRQWILDHPDEFAGFSLYDEETYSGYLVLTDPPRMLVSSFRQVHRQKGA